MEPCLKCGYVKPKLTTQERGERIKHGFKYSKKKLGRPRTVSFEQIKKLRYEGFTYEAIAEFLGTTRATVYYALKRASKK